MIGFAMCGSFCNFKNAFIELEKLVAKGYEVLPIMSYNSFTTDTRFGKACDFIDRAEKLCGRSVVHTLCDAEPLGPKIKLDCMCICPCTGNTLAKLALGIYDTPVTLAVKSHLRNQKPVLIGVSSNDSLSSSAKNIGALLNYKHYYFVPMTQDDPIKKPFSIVCDFDKTYKAAEYALRNQQIEPIIF